MNEENIVKTKDQLLEERLKVIERKIDTLMSEVFMAASYDMTGEKTEHLKGRVDELYETLVKKGTKLARKSFLEGKK